MADSERTTFIGTLESMTTFFEAVENDFRMNKLDHLGQVDRVESSFQSMLNSADGAGDVGLMLNHKTRGLHDSLFDLSAAVREKVEQNITFSKQASEEVESLCKQSRTFLKVSIEFLLTDTPALLTWLDNKQKECKEYCDKFATSHEERLIEGVCTPNASMVYLDMLHAFKGIHSHATNIIWLLAGLCGIYQTKHDITE